jgi:ubiquinone/menaquinone biosynthesis C-methylase UbiE
MPLDARAARRLYDRLGRLQDTQAFYEQRALRRMAAAVRLRDSQRVFELGCGTGRWAEELLRRDLRQDAHYVGVDISPTMVDLTRQRLGPWRARAKVHLLDPAESRLPGDDEVFDRFVSTYVLDLVSLADADHLLKEAWRLLAPGGLLGLVSLTHGVNPASRLVSRAWAALATWAPQLVGGCRPVELIDLLPETRWAIESQEVVISWAVPSEVVVARRRSEV